MSRRKQSKPRQIKRSIGDLDTGDENPPDDVSLSGDEGGASDLEDSAELDGCSPPSLTPLCSEEPRTHDSLMGPDEEEEEEEERGPTQSTEEEEEMEAEGDGELHWLGPEELELSEGVDGLKVLASRDLPVDTLWGPYPGTIQSEEPVDASTNEGTVLTLLCEDMDCWLVKVPVTAEPSEANCTIYSQGEELFCKLTQEVSSGGDLVARLSCTPMHKTVATQSHNAPVKEEPAYPAGMLTEIQLLPQQAGMAAILATAVINKDIFPCKDCGIWYRSERNLHAHLMYYCASRQKQPAASSPPQDKSKDSYPNERVCPFPQCNKSCPSASSLEIHMRTHSGERPFMCLICLSAFTTKANCERHLKVHTDTLSGVCHGCGFISTTRDILYSHLVTSHMVCQPGARSDSYSPGPGTPKLPLAAGLSPGDSGIVLKCQVCGAAADTPALLQQHVRTHLEVRMPAERSPTPRQGTNHSSSTQHPKSQDRESAACVPRPNSSSPGTNGGSSTPRGGCSPLDLLPCRVRVKEEPQSDTEHEGNGERDGGEEEEVRGQGGHHSDPGDGTTSQKSTSPKSPAGVAVKAEPTSPTPGSSPAHTSPGGSTLPGGAVFLPQYVFSAEAAMIPQASEILAKMSEMVHSRLKQGQGQLAVTAATAAAAAAAAAQQGFYPSGSPVPVHKGAHCFECDITFNNINNFYVHKRLYCSSRHHQGEPAPGHAKDVTTASAVPPPSGGASGGSRAASASPSEVEAAAPGGASEGRPAADVKSEPHGGSREVGCSSSSEGEGGGVTGGGRASEGSASPNSGGGGGGGGGSATEEPEDDPTRTFCGACNIRFSRHDNYLVHKRFYCASRHDPSQQRVPPAAKAAFLPQPIRTRKRKKMYEIHMARSQALASSSSVLPGLPVKQEVASAAAATSSSSSAGIPGMHSPSTSPEGEGPIDLSKRPRVRGGSRGGGGGGGGSGLPALPLSDYHKCTACSISFNSIENYLAHKTYYCPATTLQPHTLEQLQRLKRPASTSPKSLHAEGPTPPKVASAGKASLGAVPVAHLPSLPGSEASTSPPHAVHSAKLGGTAAPHPPTGAAPVVCPYCPPGRALTTDLVEHFRSAHGLVLSLQQGEAQTTAAPISPSSSGSPRDAAPPTTSPRPSPRPRRDSINAPSLLRNGSPPSPQVNGSPAGGGVSPKAVSQALSPTGALQLTVSPVPEAGLNPAPHTPPEKPLPIGSTLTPVAPPKPAMGAAVSVAALQNGSTCFCRLCNIKFSSLSTFIAHKKYYCSSHSAEHVK
ncbi:zinc finger protein ZFPM1 isoform X2 [Clupea harengus]|uniref:Zinc finger protein ZFPM1 isoform X2 n=1 Tax=Clupea harengus TaxID=7950 RepID=A0A6P3W2N8_CLUHA|nr:zinc finger protein ZFPM1 isoform X2 [Clupea harengus]